LGAQFERKYTERQRAAAGFAALSRRAADVVDLAARGELADADGRLDAFTISLGSVERFRAQERERRRREELMAVPSDEALERVAKRLLVFIDGCVSEMARRGLVDGDLDEIRTWVATLRDLKPVVRRPVADRVPSVPTAFALAMLEESGLDGDAGHGWAVPGLESYPTYGGA
jgi:hypothetical protein